MLDITAIIPAAGLPQNALFPGIFDLMIPINGKPIVDYIIGDLQKWGIENVIVLLNKNDEKTYNYLNFRKSKINLNVKRVDTNSLGETIYNSLEFVKTDKILIHLGDTIYNGELDISMDNILIKNKKVANPQKWCFIDGDKNFVNNPSEITEDYRLIIGLYYIENSGLFFDKLKSNSFYGTLSIYSKTHNFNFQDINENYYDLGHLEEYYKSKIDFLRVRSFNSLEYDDFRGIITKKSSNNQKLLWEINWFRNIPQDIKSFTPRLIDYKLGVPVNYSLEFYGYNSLADIFLYSDYPYAYFQSIIDKLFKYQQYVKKNYNDGNFSIKNLYDMYLGKTFSRIDEMLEITLLKDLYERDELIINGKIYKNIKHIISKDYILHVINNDLYKKDDFTIIHGDMCFSNILYDTSNGIFKFIDPRGNFGEEGVWGDIKYDFAKLRHSVHGKYEYIISDLFNIQLNMEHGEFEFTFFNSVSDSLVEYYDFKLVENGYNVDTIKFIEGLLYLSMIPLHSDSLDRQIVMYLTSVILFNETIKSNKLI